MSGDFIARGDAPYPLVSSLNATGVIGQNYRGLNATIGQDGRLYAASNGGSSGSADVSEFGVIYNTTSVDNTAAMQRAINAAQGQGGFELILSGYVSLNGSTPLMVTDGISIRGLQPWNNVNCFTGFIQQNSNIVTILQTASNKQMWLRDFMILYFHGATAGVPAIRSLPSSAIISSNRFYNLGFFQVGTGIHLHNNTVAVIASCFMSCWDVGGSANYGITLSASGDFVNFGDSTIVNTIIENFNVGIYQTGSPGLRVVNNKLLLNGTAFQLAQANGFGDLFIWNNSIENCLTNALVFGTTSTNTFGEILVANNEIQGVATMVNPLVVFTPNGTVTSWNVGVSVNNNHLIYQGSTVTTAFISFSGCTAFSMAGNVLENYAGSGFPAYTIDSSCLNGNVEYNAAVFGTVTPGTSSGTNVTQNVVATKSTVTNTNIPFYNASGFLSSSTALTYNNSTLTSPTYVTNTPPSSKGTDAQGVSPATINNSTGFIQAGGSGIVQLSGGTATVTSLTIFTTSLIFVTAQTIDATSGFLAVSGVTGAGFTITSSNALDGNMVAWFAI